VVTAVRLTVSQMPGEARQRFWTTPVCGNAVPLLARGDILELASTAGGGNLPQRRPSGAIQETI